MVDDDSMARTRALARMIGPYLVLMAATLFVRRETLPAVFADFTRDPALGLISGVFTFIVGMAIVAIHRHWRGPSACAISLIGIAAALKGAMLVIAPDVGANLTAMVARTPAILIAVAVVMLPLGAWLSVVGWTRRA